MDLSANNSAVMIHSSGESQETCTKPESSLCGKSCEMSGQCPVPGDQGVSAIFKKRYCDNNWTQCARYRLHSHEHSVRIPDWLLPNMADEAQSLLEQYC
jgi:hypothetical protein